VKRGSMSIQRAVPAILLHCDLSCATAVTQPAAPLHHALHRGDRSLASVARAVKPPARRGSGNIVPHGT
jgi:hypothetical protein